MNDFYGSYPLSESWMKLPVWFEGLVVVDLDNGTSKDVFVNLFDQDDCSIAEFFKSNGVDLENMGQVILICDSALRGFVARFGFDNREYLDVRGKTMGYV